MDQETENKKPERNIFKGISSLTLYDNDNFIVLNKPSGMLSIPDRTQSEPSLKDHLLQKLGTVFTVHRLDRDTSGVIVFAKNEQTHKYLSQQFEDRSTGKTYYGLVMGKLDEPAGTIDQPIAEHYSQKGTMMISAGGKPSLTDYRLLEQFKSFSWLQFAILTGRTHQIRVHMKHLGHPIACDPLYGDAGPLLLSAFKKKFNLAKSAETENPLLNRLALHAAELRFKGTDGREQAFEAPLPKDLKALLQQLRKWNS